MGEPIRVASPGAGAAATRDWAVAVLVVHDGRVLMHWHRKLDRWLPPGGHVEPNELPDEAAVREVFEETGVQARLLGAPDESAPPTPSAPRPLCRPAGIQLEAIAPGHEHIDLVYFATGEPAAPRDQVGWFGPDELHVLALTDEVAEWCHAALAAVAERTNGPGAPYER